MLTVLLALGVMVVIVDQLIHFITLQYSERFNYSSLNLKGMVTEHLVQTKLLIRFPITGFRFL